MDFTLSVTNVDDDELYAAFREHDIHCLRSPNLPWYIWVTGPDGMRVYDGYWNDSHGRTKEEALQEALQGSKLLTFKGVPSQLPNMTIYKVA